MAWTLITKRKVKKPVANSFAPCDSFHVVNANNVTLENMIDIDTIKAGHIATVLLQGEHKMNKGGRSGIPVNPLTGRVTRDHRIIANVAGIGSYGRRLEKEGREPVGKPTWWEWVKDGVVRHKVTGELYIAALPSSAKLTTRYLVDGREATPKELETIRSYTPEKDNPEFLLFKMENVVNVAD
jgi:hypothetical protein